MLSVIARYVHQTIVRPGPDHALFDRRFRQRKHRIVVLDAGMSFVSGPPEDCCLALSFRVRSPLMAVHDIPPSVVLNTASPP